MKPLPIFGRWRAGWTLDDHTVSSEFVGNNAAGHAEFATTRTEIGELLYRLKYKEDTSTIPSLVNSVERMFQIWRLRVDVLVPVPSSTPRRIQPVYVLGEAVAQRMKLDFAPDAVRRTQELPQLKNVTDYDQRRQLLRRSHQVDPTRVKGRRVLLFDDLYQSGATMNEIVGILQYQGGALEIYALAVTRTKR